MYSLLTATVVAARAGSILAATAAIVPLRMATSLWPLTLLRGSMTWPPRNSRSKSGRWAAPQSPPPASASPLTAIVLTNPRREVMIRFIVRLPGRAGPWPVVAASLPEGPPPGNDFPRPFGLHTMAPMTRSIPIALALITPFGGVVQQPGAEPLPVKRYLTKD